MEYEKEDKEKYMLNSQESTKPKTQSKEEINEIMKWLSQVKDSSTREDALLELSKKRESFADLAIYIWYYPGIIATLLQAAAIITFTPR